MSIRVAVFAIFYSGCLVCAQQCPTPVGNTVRFPDVSESVTPVTSTLKTTYDAHGLQTFFDLANSFMNTVLSEPIEDKFTKDDFDKISDTAVRDKIIKYETPVAVAVGFGLLFAILMPIVGLCFCCCRCCGNCGGEMVQCEEDAANHTKCCVCSFVMLVFVIFLLCGVLFMFVCNSRLTTAVSDIGPQYTSSIDEAINYANTTINELEFLSGNQLDCTINLVVNDIDDNGLKRTLGEAIKTALVPRIGVALDAVIQATANVSEMNTKLQLVRNSTADLQTAANTLSTSLTHIRDNLTIILQNCANITGPSSVCSGIDANALQQNANFSALPDVDTELSKIQDILQKNFSGAAQEGKRVFDNIPTTVADKTQSIRKDILNMTDNGRQKMRDTVSDVTGDIQRSLINERSKLLEYRQDYIDDNVKYDKYRNYAFLALGGITALIFLCLALGLLCGVCGYSRQTEPSNRSKLSNCGGNCLMAGVGFMFIFAFTLMLITVLFFVVGIHLHLGCNSIKDGRAIDKFADGSLKFDGQELKVADILSSCRNDAPLYGAIDGKRFLDVNEKINISKLVGNVDDEINKLNVSLSDQSVLNNETRTALLDLSTSQVDNIDFNTFFSELQKGILKVDLPSLIANLTNMEESLRQFGTTSGNVRATALADDTAVVIGNLNTLKTTQIPIIMSHMNQLESDVRDLSTLSSGLKNISLDLLQKLEDADTFLRTRASAIVTSEVLKFSSRVLGWLEQFSEHVKTQITTKIAHCKPVADLYDGIIGATFCGSLVGNLNGFWLALGWCLFFFIPLIIFSVKLAKYYRRMKCLDGFGFHDYNSYPSYDRTNDKIPLQQMDRPPPYNYQNSGYKGH